MIDYIDAFRGEFGVEPICRVLAEHGVPIAPSSYHAARTRPPSPRALSDAALVEVIEATFWDREKGRGVYGARKMWHQLRRDGVTGSDGAPVARCTVERLMRSLGLRGARRGHPVVTTRPDRRSERAPDDDNAMAESVIGLYKTECVRRDGPWRTVDDLELATLSWVHWFNHQRLHSKIGNVPPAEHEQTYYRQQATRDQPVSGEPSRH